MHSERKVSIVDFKTLLKNKNKSDKKYILLDGAIYIMPCL